jgi:UDP-GlcNAc:undecaprenyl-phosphate/decaprenyl-phosphate GlcNAc-1-phosphate transferase
LFIAFLALVVSLAVSILLVRFPKWHLRFSKDDLSKPQAFHAHQVSRVGGLAVAAGMLAGGGVATYEGRLTVPLASGLALVALLAFASGFVEDLTKRVRPLARLAFTAAAGVAALWVLGVTVPRLDLPWFESWWQSLPWLGACVAVLAVAGLPHALNLIDGYNGLMAMVAVMTLCAIGYVAYLAGDRELMLLCGIGVGTVVGFLVLNYPRGLIFAGDGGAYLIGAYIATLSILLIQRHQTVSPWFALLVVAYPVCETGFSIYRKLVRGHSPGMADALHIHQLIYRRVVTRALGKPTARELLRRNSATSPYLWAMAFATVLPAMLFFDSTPILLVCLVTFFTAYVWLYVRLVRFRTPSLLGNARPRK